VTPEGKYRILVVDDEASVLMTYRLILEQQGYEVVACDTSVEAIAAIGRQLFDAVLCDYSLEDQHTGFEVLAAARARDANVPAALVTGYATQDTVDEAVRRNIGTMFKPIEIEEFLATTANMLRSNQPATCASGKKEGGKEAEIADLPGPHEDDRRDPQWTSTAFRPQNPKTSKRSV
jgi:DNA-binding NtrC family response regulator